MTQSPRSHLRWHLYERGSFCVDRFWLHPLANWNRSRHVSTLHARVWPIPCHRLPLAGNPTARRSHAGEIRRPVALVRVTDKAPRAICPVMSRMHLSRHEAPCVPFFQTSVTARLRLFVTRFEKTRGRAGARAHTHTQHASITGGPESTAAK